MKIQTVVVCDDIRREASGKFILIGVYPDDILVSDYPATLSVAPWTQFFVDRTDDVPLEFRILRDNDEQMIFGEGKVRVANINVVATVPFPRLVVRLDRDSLLQIQLREQGKEWQTIREISVKKQPSKE